MEEFKTLIHKMKPFYFSVLLSFIIASCSAPKFTFEQVEKQVTKAETERIITTLASDDHLGRYPHSETYEKSMAFVEDFFEKNKIKPFYKEGYRDVLSAQSHSANIVGLVGDYDRSKEHVVIGAHLDHLGIAHSSEKDSIYNGANDNASGVTAVLMLAKTLSQQKFNKNVILVLFTEEESGLLGAKHLATRFKSEGVKISYMLNFEMLGVPMKRNPDKVYITGFNRSNCAQVMNKMAGKDFVIRVPQDEAYRLFYAADNFPFYKVLGIPSHTICTFNMDNYDYYHHLSDEVSKLDMNHLNYIIQNTTYIITQMLKNDVTLELFDK